MDIDLASKLLLVLVSAQGLWKVLRELSNLRRETLRERYRFAREFFSDLKSKEPLHPYLLEIGYQAVSGGTSLTTREIEYLLTLPEPAKSIRDYQNARAYFEHAATAGEKQLLLGKRFQAPWVLRSLNWLYWALFILTYTAAWMPLVVPAIPTSMGIRIVVATTLTVSIFGPMAYFFFRQGTRVISALALIRRGAVHESHNRQS